MSRRRNKCCAGVTCVVAQDEYSSDSIGSYSQPSGAHSISGGTLNCTTAGTIVHNNTHSGDAHAVQGDIYIDSDSGGFGSVILNYTDEDNYHEVRLTPGSGDCATFALYEKEGGTLTELGTGWELQDFVKQEVYTIRGCHDGVHLTGMILGEEGEPWMVRQEDASQTMGTGTKAGFRNASSNKVDNFLFHKIAAGCISCALSCEMHADDFDRDDASDLGCEWTNQAGSAEIDENKAAMTGNDCIILSDIFDRHIRLDGQIIEGMLRGTEVGVQVRLIAGYRNDTDYWFVEVEYFYGHATLQMFKMTAGGKVAQTTQKTMSGQPGAGYRITLCVEPTGATVTATYAQTGTTVLDAPDNAPGNAGLNTVTLTTPILNLGDGTKAGFGCGQGSTTVGAVTVDDWKGSRTHRDRDLAGCAKCGDGDDCKACEDAVPASLVLDFIGFSSSPNSCCTNNNGSYSLLHVGGFAPDCVWEHEHSAGTVPCDFSDPDSTGIVRLTMSYDEDDDVTTMTVLKAVAYIASQPEYETWIKTFVGKVECEDMDVIFPQPEGNATTCDTLFTYVRARDI